jgi:hypothetical protein
MVPPLEVIVAVEHSLFWGKGISIILNCQEKMETALLPYLRGIKKGKMFSKPEKGL